jgi:uncharacterized membrane protein YoaK (UPF0700 family)
VERFGTSERLFVAALSSLAGYVDAVGFAQSKGFFVSFMSGNSTRLGVGLAGSYWDALAAAGLVFSFIVGVATGTLIGRRNEARRVSSVMGAVAVFLALAAWFGSHHHLLASLAMTALAMGAENATLERDGRVRFGLTYMTGSVVKIGQALADLLSGVRTSGWLGSTLLLVSFVLGAMTGAFAAASFSFAALWFACATAAILAVLGQARAGLFDRNS